MPRLLAAATASTVRPDVVSPNCSLITFTNCKLFSSTLPSQHPTPPRPLCALLSTSRSGPGRGPLRRLLGQPFVQRGLRHLAAGTFGAELILDLSQRVGRAGTHIGFSRRSKGLKLSA